MKNKKKAVYLPLTHALAWIVGSTLIFSGSAFAGVKHYLKMQREKASDPKFVLRTIIQTGPQKEALKTEYLAELLGIASDRPCSAKAFDLKRAKEILLSSPLISHADVKWIKPSTLYIDYTVRQPIARLEDYSNVVVDKEGYLFPFTPFFTPKKLPGIYLGLGPFGKSLSSSDGEIADWNTPLRGKYFKLALDLLSIVTDSKVADLFAVKRIDVSNAFSESYGTREIVIITEDSIYKSLNGNQIQITAPRILRLSTKNYSQELGNYLKLRPQLLEEENKNSLSSKRLKEKIIDFRIPKLAFIED